MKITSIVMLAALIATPAFAGHVTKKMPHRSHGYVAHEHHWRNSHARYRGGYIRGPNVYSPSGRFIGRDPSLNVRQQMYDENMRIRGSL